MAKSKAPKPGALRVWWIPQIPMEPFIVPVRSLAQGEFLLRVLADYDKFQFEHRVKPDYSNTGGVQVFNGEWDDWDYESDEVYQNSHPTRHEKRARGCR